MPTTCVVWIWGNEEKPGEKRAVKVKEALSLLSDVSITVFNVQLLSVKKRQNGHLTFCATTVCSYCLCAASL